SYANTKSTQKKGDPQSGSPALRYGATCGARAKRGPAKLAFGSDNAGPDPLVSALLGPARTGQSGAGANTNKDTPWRVLVDFCIGIFAPTPSGCAEER